MKEVLLYLSKSKLARNATTKFPLLQKFTRRFVAGEKLEDVINVIKNLNERKTAGCINHLGENVLSEKDSVNATQNYMDILDTVEKNRLDSNISVKLTHLGLGINDSLCRDNIEKIVQKARKLGIFVEIDMESSKYTERTLSIFFNIRKKYKNIGIAIQSYLYRSEKDIGKLTKSKSMVRLCKGAYKESGDIAFQRKEDVDKNFEKLMRILLEKRNYIAIATHDNKLIKKAIEISNNNKIQKNRFEFQLLYGIRDDLRDKLVMDGYKVRIYVPFGTYWYPYFMRRLAERPENVLFLFRNLFK